MVAPLLWRFLGIRILQERPISHRKLSRRQVLPINGWGKDLEMFTNLGYVSTKVLRVALVVALGATLAALTAVALVATSGTALGQRGQAPTQPLYEVHDLGTLAGGSFSYAFGINEAGKVVGAAATSNNEVHAFLYSGGQMQDLGTLGGSFSRAVDINEAGKAVGASTTSGDAQQHTFLYSRGQMQDLGTLAEPYNSHSFATALNNKGEVVGQSSDSDGIEHPFLYSSGVMRDLNSLIPADSGWELVNVEDINDKGHIVSKGINKDGREHAFLLTPVHASAP
jgi:probable HAF family extracellular repeat protein